MSLYACAASLILTDPRGGNVTEASVAHLLEAARRPGSAVQAIECSGKRPSARFDFGRVGLAVRHGDPDASETFFLELEKWLTEIGEWILSIPSSTWEELKARGLKAELLVIPEIDQDQMEIVTPALLCAAAGHAGNSIYILTNDL